MGARVTAFWRLGHISIIWGYLMPLIISDFQSKTKCFYQILGAGYSDTFFLRFSWVFDLASDMSVLHGDSAYIKQTNSKLQRIIIYPCRINGDAFVFNATVKTPVLPTFTSGSHTVSGRISLLALAVSFYCFLHPSCRSHAASRVGTFFSSKQSFIPLLFLPLPESGHLTSLSLNYV